MKSTESTRGAAKRRCNGEISAAGLFEVTVCIVTYNRDEKLIECLGKLAQSTLQPSQVFIVDNGRSAELLEHLEDVPLSIEQI